MQRVTVLGMKYNLKYYTLKQQKKSPLSSLLYGDRKNNVKCSEETKMKTTWVMSYFKGNRLHKINILDLKR